MWNDSFSAFAPSVSARFTLTAAALAAVVALPSIAHCQDEATKSAPGAATRDTQGRALAKVNGETSSLDFVIDSQLFEELCDYLALSPSQRSQALDLFRSFSDVTKSLDAELQDRVMNSGFEQYSELYDRAWEKHLEQNPGPSASPMSPDLLPRERLTALYLSWRATQIEGWRKYDSMVEAWYASLSAILSVEQQDRLPAAKRLLRRLSYFRRLASSGPGMPRGFDLGRLTPAALFLEAESTGRLACLLDPASKTEESPREVSTEKLEEGRRRVKEAVERYELAVDEILVQRDRRAREMPNLAPGEYVDESDDLARRIRTTKSGLYRALDNYVVDVAQVVEETFGHAEREQWFECYYRLLIPSMYVERAPDYFHRWLSLRDDASDEQRTASNGIYDDYLVQAEAIKRRLIDLAIQLELAIGKDEKRQALAEKYNSAAAQWRDLIARTLDGMSALLTLDQSESFDASYFNERAYRNVRLIGPTQR